MEPFSRHRAPFLLDLLFPPRCPFCGQLTESSRDPVCPGCKASLPRIPDKQVLRQVAGAQSVVCAVLAGGKKPADPA